MLYPLVIVQPCALMTAIARVKLIRIVLADNQLSRIEVLDHSRPDKRRCSQLELGVEHNFFLDPISPHEPTDIERVPPQAAGLRLVSRFAKVRTISLGCRPGLSHGLICKASCPCVTVRGPSSPGLMAR